MTEPLYYTDSYTTDFSAAIRSISDDGREIVLDRTFFYPEGGGQPADKGTLNGVAVVDVQKRDDGTIVHTLNAPLPEDISTGAPGTSLSGEIEWSHRFEYMQQHSGQHVLSAALLEIARAATVSVAQGSEVTSIEIDTDELSDEMIERIVSRANEVIRDDVAIKGFWVDDSELSRFSLRRPTERRGKIRLVQIGEAPYDLVACGGVHLPRTGLLNLVAIHGVERIRGHQRLHFKIGNRALEHYRVTHATLGEAAELFSAQPSDVPERIRQEISSGQDLRRASRLQNERIAGYIVSDAERGSAGESDTRPAIIRLRNEDLDLFKAVAEIAADRATATAATDETERESPAGASRVRYIALNTIGDTLHWAIATGETPFPAEEIRTTVLQPINAKGGGKPPLWRGIVPSATRETVEQFVQAIGTIW